MEPAGAPRHEPGLLDAPHSTGGGRPAEAATGLTLAALLAVGGAVLHPGVLPSASRVVVWAAAAAMVVLALAGRTGLGARVTRLAPWASVGASIVGAAAAGSAGHAGPAVVAVIPMAWVAGSDHAWDAALVGVTGAAVAGLGAGALTGAVGPGDAITALVAGAVALLVAWAGRTAADEIGLADLERAELRRLRTEMVTTVSHELRTPLTVIQGATATLSRRWDVLSEPERLDLVDVLTENVASLDASIMHFADAARLERGEVILTPEWVEVAQSLDAAASRRAAALAGHEIRTDLAVDRVWADPVALERIIEHLLLNAARFSSVGLPISVRLVAGPADVTLTVADQGQGIAPRLLSTVWEPLQRGDVSDTGVSRGAGLGLPIVRELARLHGGDATLSSVRGRGTSVSVTFPQPAEGTAPVWRRPDHIVVAEMPRRGALSRRGA